MKTAPSPLTALRQLVIRLGDDIAAAQAKEQHWHDAAANAESVSEAATALGEWEAAKARTAQLRHQRQNAQDLIRQFSPAAPVLAKDPDARLVTSNAAPAAQPGSSPTPIAPWPTR